MKRRALSSSLTSASNWPNSPFNRPRFLSAWVSFASLAITAAISTVRSRRPIWLRRKCKACNLGCNLPRWKYTLTKCLSAPIDDFEDSTVALREPRWSPRLGSPAVDFGPLHRPALAQYIPLVQGGCLFLAGRLLQS